MHIKGLRVPTPYISPSHSLSLSSPSRSLRGLHTVIYTGPDLEIQFDSAWNESGNSVRVAARSTARRALLILSARNMIEKFAKRVCAISKRRSSWEFSKRDVTSFAKYIFCIVHIKRLDRASLGKNFRADPPRNITFKSESKKISVCIPPNTILHVAHPASVIRI